VALASEPEDSNRFSLSLRAAVHDFNFGCADGCGRAATRPAALFNAALSNILGVVLTPVLVELLMRKTGQSSSIGPLLLK